MYHCCFRRLQKEWWSVPTLLLRNVLTNQAPESRPQSSRLAFRGAARRGLFVNFDISMTDASAALTASAFGKAFAISGSSFTTLDPLPARSKYFPRTPFPAACKASSVNFLSRGSVVLALLIDFPFRAVRISRTDSSKAGVCFNVRNHQQPVG